MRYSTTADKAGLVFSVQYLHVGCTIIAAEVLFVVGQLVAPGVGDEPFGIHQVYGLRITTQHIFACLQISLFHA